MMGLNEFQSAGWMAQNLYPNTVIKPREGLKWLLNKVWMTFIKLSILYNSLTYLSACYMDNQSNSLLERSANPPLAGLLEPSGTTPV